MTEQDMLEALIKDQGAYYVLDVLASALACQDELTLSKKIEALIPVEYLTGGET